MSGLFYVLTHSQKQIFTQLFAQISTVVDTRQSTHVEFNQHLKHTPDPSSPGRQRATQHEDDMGALNDMRIDSTLNSTPDMRPEWCPCAFVPGLAWPSDLGCIDAPDRMPAGSVKRMTSYPESRIQAVWYR